MDQVVLATKAQVKTQQNSILLIIQMHDNGCLSCIITRMSELNKDKSSSDDNSMPGLQDRIKENSSSDGDTNSYGNDGIYDDGEDWRYKAQTLKQIIGGKPGSMFLNNTSTLYAFSWHGYAKISVNPVIENEDTDFHQAREEIRFPIGLTTTKIKLWITKSHRFSVCMIQDHLLGSDKT